MDTGLLHGAATMRAMEQRLEATAMNLANAETPGYKRLRAGEESFEVTLRRAGRLPPRYPHTRFVRDFSQGDLVATGDRHELSLSGKGFFVAEDGSGTKLTRHVNFSIDQAGYLTLNDGSRLLGQGGPIVVPPGESRIAVNKEGTVSAAGSVVGELRVVTSEKPQRLKALGDGLYRASPGDRLPLAKAEVRQGMRERSNVAVVDEMVDLMTIQHTYQASFRTMQARSQVMQRMIQQSV